MKILDPVDIWFSLLWITSFWLRSIRLQEREHVQGSTDYDLRPRRFLSSARKEAHLYVQCKYFASRIFLAIYICERRNEIFAPRIRIAYSCFWPSRSFAIGLQRSRYTNIFWENGSIKYRIHAKIFAVSDLLKFRRKLEMILTFYSRIKLQSRRANLAVKKTL